MSLDTKRAEIKKLEERARQREEALKKSEQMLEEDALRFDAFLKENDEKVQEAIKRAEMEAKAKQDKVLEIKRLTTAIAALRSEMNKVCRWAGAWVGGRTGTAPARLCRVCIHGSFMGLSSHRVSGSCARTQGKGASIATPEYYLPSHLCPEQYEEQLEDCRKYKEFLDSITPPEWFEAQVCGSLLPGAAPVILAMTCFHPRTRGLTCGCSLLAWMCCLARPTSCSGARTAYWPSGRLSVRQSSGARMRRWRPRAGLSMTMQMHALSR
jgi:hypothetical protein